VLSGGEKSRLALARLLVNPPNLLLMDEPTTHLDIPSIDALLNALKQYEGTLIFISHDVYFIRQIARTVLHVHAGRLTPYAGGYDYYLEKSRATNARAALTAGFTDARPGAATTPAAADLKSKTSDLRSVVASPRPAAKPKPAELKKRRIEVSRLEQRVSELETRQNELTAELEKPETYQQPGQAQHLNRELTATVDLLQAATAEWEAAATRLEELEKA